MMKRVARGHRGGVRPTTRDIADWNAAVRAARRAGAGGRSWRTGS